MNIIILNSSKQWGGNERWLISLANGLIKKKHSVFLCIRKGSQHWKNLDEKIKILEAPFTNELSIKTKMILYQIFSGIGYLMSFKILLLQFY